MADRSQFVSLDEEEKTAPSSSTDKAASRSFRSTWPAYTIRIEGFSLMRGVINNSQSSSFEAGGYHWKLVLYFDRDGYISFYLVIEDKDNHLHVGEDVYVNFKLLLYDQLRGRFLAVQDGDGRITRYNKLRTKHGFPQFISLDVFNDAPNGYLIDDACIFGAEVFVIDKRAEGEVLSIVDHPIDHNFVWRINNFSEIKEDVYYSEELHVAGRKWKMGLVPKGKIYNDEMYLYVALHLVDEEDGTSSSSVHWISKIIGRGFERYFRKQKNRLAPKIYIRCVLQARDQLQGGYEQESICKWFGDGKLTGQRSWSSRFIPLSELHDPARGFLVDDALIIEVKIPVAVELKNIYG